MVVIGIVSGKGGVGKTTTAINVGVVLCKLGQSVIIVDANLTTPNVGLFLGLTSPSATFKDALNGTSSRKVTFAHSSGLKFIPGSLSANYVRRKIPHFKGKVKRLLSNLKKTYGFVLVDIESGLDESVMNILKACDEALVITNPQMPAVTEAGKIMQLCGEAKIPIRGLVVNRVGYVKAELSRDEIEEVFGVPVISSIPEDKRVYGSVDKAEPLVLIKGNSPAAKHFAQLAFNLAGLPYEPTHRLFDRIKAFFTLLKEKLSKGFRGK